MTPLSESGKVTLLTKPRLFVRSWNPLAIPGALPRAIPGALPRAVPGLAQSLEQVQGWGTQRVVRSWLSPS